MKSIHRWAPLALAVWLWTSTSGADVLKLHLQSQTEAQPGSGQFEVATRDEAWQPKQTAIIVCDFWDLHHCRNAVRRMEEFGPRLNTVLTKARDQGMTIIHAPSDCMPAYLHHAARGRTLAVPRAANLPADIDSWCLRIASEERAIYPIDQSDGGEDDDPVEHKAWAAKLTALGRNPGMPWARQSDMITIDGERDYISDRGEEVWNVLESRGIRHVILTGVHTNMCVLGRPFGLRQMVRAGKQVVLMRDMTDTMYNPARWPYVSHYEGTHRVIAHIEKYVCPTVTSDQILGGQPFRFAAAIAAKSSATTGDASSASTSARRDYESHWSLLSVPGTLSAGSKGVVKSCDGAGWYRCVVRVPLAAKEKPVALVLPPSKRQFTVWLNGQPIESQPTGSGRQVFAISADKISWGEANLIVVRIDPGSSEAGFASAPIFLIANAATPLAGRWQFRMGDDPSWSNMPLPAKFGTSTDIIFELAP